MSSSKKLFSHSFNYFLGSVITMLAGLISFPLWTRVLSISEYGMFCTITITITFLTAFLKFGNQQAAVRYYHEFTEDMGKSYTYYSTIILGTFFIASIITVLFILILKIFFENHIGEFWTVLLMLAAFSALLGALIQIFMNFFRAEQSVVTYNLIGILNRYGELGICFVLVVLLSFGLYGMFIGQILSEIIVLALMVFLLIRNKGTVVKISRFSLSFLKEAVRYGFPLIWLELANNALAISDRYIILFFGGAEDVAIYSAGYNASEYCIAFLYRPIWLAVVPLYLSIWKNEGREKTESFLSKTMQYYLLIGIPIVFGISYLGKELITLLATSRYQDASMLMPYVSISYLVFGMMSICSAGIHIQKRTKILMHLSAIAAVTNIMLNFIMIPWLGILGAAIATLLSYILLVVIVSYKASKFLTIKVNLPRTVKYIILSSLMIYVIGFYSSESLIAELLVKSISGGVFYLAVIVIIDSEARSLFIRGKDRVFAILGLNSNRV